VFFEIVSVMQKYNRSALLVLLFGYPECSIHASRLKAAKPAH